MTKTTQRYDVLGFGIFIFSFVVLAGFGFILQSPIWEAMKEGKPDDWLGFLGNLIAGLFTLLAAVIAWFAVKNQVSLAQSDAAQQRLTAYADALERVRVAWEAMIRAPVASLSRAEEEKNFRSATASDLLFSAALDPIMGLDGRRITEMLDQMVRSAIRTQPSLQDATFDLWLKLVKSVAERRAWLQRGGKPSELYNRRDVT